MFKKITDKSEIKNLQEQFLPDIVDKTFELVTFTIDGESKVFTFLVNLDEYFVVCV